MPARKKIVKPAESLGEFQPMNACRPNVEYNHPFDVDIGVFQMYDDVPMPFYATEWAACFDLTAWLTGSATVECFNRLLHHQYRAVTVMKETGKPSIYLEPGESALIPTGLIFDIPHRWHIKIHPRSGLAVKKHLRLANCTGIVDADYVKQTFMPLYNDTEVRQIIAHEERVAQAEVVPMYRACFGTLPAAPGRKTSRDGGFGHTKGHASLV